MNEDWSVADIKPSFGIRVWSLKTAKLVVKESKTLHNNGNDEMTYLFMAEK